MNRKIPTAWIAVAMAVCCGETETAAIRLDLPNLKAGEEVVVSASNVP